MTGTAAPTFVRPTAHQLQVVPLPAVPSHSTPTAPHKVDTIISVFREPEAQKGYAMLSSPGSTFFFLFTQKYV